MGRGGKYPLRPFTFAAVRVHKVYWRGKLAAGEAAAFGPVADPAAGWGVGIN